MRLRSSGCSQFHQSTLKVLNLAVNYLPLMEDKIFIKHARDKRYAGHPIDEREENDQDFCEGGR